MRDRACGQEVQGWWVFLPTSITVAVSENGTEYRTVGTIKVQEPVQNKRLKIQNLVVPCERAAARFVKVRVASVRVCPPWYKGAGEKAWVFVDGITTEE